MATQFLDSPAQPERAVTGPGIPQRRDWRAAWRALRKLLADGDDTEQVFHIMRALNGDTSSRNYRRMLADPQGGKLAFRQTELSQRFMDRAWLDTMPDGSVGAHYRDFLDRTGFSAEGLAEVAYTANKDWRNVEHPYAWFGRRERDIHDIWHILTGYTAEEHLGEACLVAFSYAQTGGLGWAFIGGGAALKSLKVTGERKFAAAVIEGYRRGRKAKWLSAEDYEALLAEPLDAARARLRIAPAVKYYAAQARLMEQQLKGI